MNINFIRKYLEGEVNKPLCVVLTTKRNIIIFDLLTMQIIKTIHINNIEHSFIGDNNICFRVKNKDKNGNYNYNGQIIICNGSSILFYDLFLFLC